MSKKIVFMFSGQGSQYYHMGKELYNKSDIFRKWMDHCSKIAEPLINTSLTEILYSDQQKKFEPFKRTLYTHPAIFIFEYSLTQLLLSWGINPDCLLGYSLGEYTANVISGVISVEDCLWMVIKQAELMEKYCPAASMMAILESPSIYSQYPEIFQNCWIAAKNYQKHFVVTGSLEKLNELYIFLKQKDISAQILPVSHGFHSELIDPCEKEFKDFIAHIALKPAQIKIVSAAYVEPIQESTVDYYWNVVRKTVEFEKTIESMEKENSYCYIDLGPTGTLASFVKYMLKPESNSEAIGTINQFGQDINSLEKLKHIIQRSGAHS